VASTVRPLLTHSPLSFTDIVWQAAYWKFVMVAKREKITSGTRVNSFSQCVPLVTGHGPIYHADVRALSLSPSLLQDKHNPIGKWMRATPPEKRESLFMFWQLVYTVVTFSPAVFYLWKSPAWSGAYIVALFAAATWNGEPCQAPVVWTQPADTLGHFALH
jgi:hypothetical protein